MGESFLAGSSRVQGGRLDARAGYESSQASAAWTTGAKAGSMDRVAIRFRRQ